MSRTTEHLYGTSLLINNTAIGFSQEIEFTADHNLKDEDTHSGHINGTDDDPACEISIKRFNTFETNNEQAILNAIDTLSDVGGTVTMITKKPNGTLVINAYNVMTDQETFTNNKSDLFEESFKLKGTSWERYTA